MRALVVGLLIVVLLSTPALALFGPKPGPPGFAAGFFCQITGCNMTGIIDMNGNEIINAIFTNVTFNQIIYVNYTQVLDPPWVLRSGDNMTGPLSMGGQDINDVDTLNASYLTGELQWYYIIGFPYHLFVNTSSQAGGDLQGTFSNLQLNSGIIGQDELNLSNITLGIFTNDVGYITDGNTGWDNNYGLITIGGVTWGNLSGTPPNNSIFYNDAGYITISSVPVNVSQLFNDAGYITMANVPINLSQFFNDEGFITIGGVTWQNLTGIPAGFADGVDNDTKYYNLSEFFNDVGYLTYTSVPVNLSQLYNDEGFITVAGVTWQNLTGTAPNLSYFYNDAGFLTAMNETDPIYVGDKYSIAFTNKSNLFEVDQILKDGVYLYFRNSTNDTYFYYNITNSTLQLYVNGKIQQDWGNSTTVYGRATFLSDAIFNNISGNYMLIDTNVIINGYANAELFVGNGSGLTQVCLSNGTGCFENATYTGPLYWSQLIGNPPNISSFPNDAGYINSSGLQAYNDTGYIDQQISVVNTTSNIASLGFEPGVHKSGAGPYLYNDSTNIYLNESYLNGTVRSLTGIFEELIMVAVVAGTGANSTTRCCGSTGEILQLLVVPASAGNKYRFNAYTTIGAEVIDSDRQIHTGNWTVAHKGSIVSNDTITYAITNAQVDETFTVRVRWRAG